MSTTESIFRPDERRAQMMVERIPWQYKWDASEGALPNWLQERTNANGAVAEENRKWIFEDGLLVHKTSDNNKLKFIGTMYQNGFVFEAEINLDETTWSSVTQNAFICWTGKGLHNGNYVAVRPIKSSGTLFLHATSWTSRGNVSLPAGFFKVRGGYDGGTTTYSIQSEGVRREVVSSATSAWSFMSWLSRYQSGGVIYIKSLKVYTY